MRRWVMFVTDQSPLFILVVAAFFALSVFFVRELNVEAFPDPAPPIVEIVTIYEGKSPEEVERLMTIPIEVALAGMDGLDGLDRLNSISLYGLSDIKCKFNYSIQYKDAKQEIINRLANVTLEDNVQPSIIPNAIGEVMRYTVDGSENLMELRTLQDWTVTRHLKTASGVEDVSSTGGFIKAYYVRVLPEKLIKYGIPLSQVIDSLSKSNINVGGRVLELGDQYYMVRGLGLIKTLNDIENSLVFYKNGRPIFVKDIADIHIGNVPRTGIIGLDTRDDVVMGTVILRKNAQSIPSLKSIHTKITELNERILPKGIKVTPYYERWDLIVTVVKKVIETAVSGVALVALVLFVFLGNVRAALLTALVIPISLLMTLALMALRGESANLLSIGAIDFGIIVDFPLILMEDYFRISKTHGAGTKSIIKAADEVGRPMFFAVVVILLAFIPIFMMSGAEAQIFSPMAKTYLYAILFTFLLTFSYLTASKYLFISNSSGSDFGFIESTRRLYESMIYVLDRRKTAVLTVVFAVVVTGLALGIKYAGSQFLPKMDEGNMYIRVVFPYSISLNKAYDNSKMVRDLLLGIPEVKTVDFKVGRPEDGTDPTGPFNSEYTAVLKPYEQWKRKVTKEQIEQFTRDELKKLFPTADTNVSQYIEDNLEEVMSGVKGENSVKIFGDDLNKLDSLAKSVKEGLERVDGIEDEGIMSELGQPNLLIDVNRENASVLGLTVRDVLDVVSAALGGKTISRVIEGERNFALLISFPSDYKNRLDIVASIPIVLPNGGVVTLSRIAAIRYDTGRPSYTGKTSKDISR